MKTFKLILTLMALCIATTIYGQKTTTKSFNGVENIRLEIASGKGFIKKGSSNEVKVTVEYTYDDDEYEAIFEQKGDVLRMREEFENRRGRWNNRGKSVWTLEIPNGMRLKVSTGSGPLEISDLKIDLSASTGSGTIDVTNLTGPTELSTGSGTLRIDNVDGDLKASTGSGGIKVRDVTGDADLTTGSGSIRVVNAEGGMRFSTGSGNVDGTGLVITDRSSFSTGSGDVEVVLGAALDGDVRISTGSGSATLDFDGNKIEGKFALEANSKSRISAPFSFDKEYKERGHYVKEATVGSKDVRIDISSGSGSAKVKK